MDHKTALSKNLWPDDQSDCDGNLTAIGHSHLGDISITVARCDKCSDVLDGFPYGAHTIVNPDVLAKFEVT